MDLLSGYQPKVGCYDEFYTETNDLRGHYKMIEHMSSSFSLKDYQHLNQRAKLDFLNQGITYSLYNSKETVETIFPFDLMPRIISSQEWDEVKPGLIQRNMALNLFIKDAYHDKKILKDKVVPESLVMSSKHYSSVMEGFDTPADIYSHICGTDLIRHSDGKFYVLEDNLRSPSGVSYVLANRTTLSRIIPSIFKGNRIHQVQNYPLELLEMLRSLMPISDANCVLLTPGQYNSAYYEHSFLARMMGIELVEGRDLYCENDHVYMNSIGRKQRVDVIYRRIDDSFLDPAVFKPKSVLGVKGLMRAYLKGNIAIVNAVGTGISDDKAICAYVPDMIKYYLNEDPIIPNVPTYICERKEDLDYVLENIESMVIKPVDMSGGYGVVIADTLTKEELSELKTQLKAKPREFIAQPKMMLSTHGTFIEESSQFEPRHVDLRTFTILGKDRQYVLPGGLSRVALKKDSLIVNSSQGGGSKDTWILMD